jgi:hypothetical protein
MTPTQHHPRAGPGTGAKRPRIPLDPRYADDLEHALDVERRRLSTKAHDRLPRTPYAIALNAGGAREPLEEDPAAAARPLGTVSWLVEDAIAQTRSLIFRPRPESSRGRGPVEAPRALVHTTRVARPGDRGPPGPRAGHSGQGLAGAVPDRPPGPAQRRPARGGEARAYPLACSRDQVVLVVEDDGTGLDAARRFPGHLSLRLPRELAGEAGEARGLDSRPGPGPVSGPGSRPGPSALPLNRTTGGGGHAAAHPLL